MCNLDWQIRHPRLRKFMHNGIFFCFCNALIFCAITTFTTIAIDFSPPTKSSLIKANGFAGPK
jgi:hypothetical protein